MMPCLTADLSRMGLDLQAHLGEVNRCGQPLTVERLEAYTRLHAPCGPPWRAMACSVVRCWWLDTRRGNVSEQLYLKQGYTRAGIIPRYAQSAHGTLDDTVIFYRML